MKWRLIPQTRQGDGMNKRRELVIALGASALVVPLGAFAQQQDRVWRIGTLDATSMNAALLEAFRKGLHELGYIEGKNLVIEYRSADGRLERLAELASELVRAKVDVIVPRGTNASQAAKNATATIPIVVAAVGSPVESGLVKSLSHPGGNITGLSSVTAELTAKRVEFIKETVPGAKRIGCLTNLSNPDAAISWKQSESEGRSLGVQLQLLDVRKSEDLAPSFEVARKQGVGALVVIGNTLMQPNRELIVELAAKHRLPTIYPAREFVDAGGLMSYSVDYAQLYYRAANFVDKIFKGAKPANMPVEEPTKYELVVNLKTAKALGLAIPSSLLLRADEVIQ
jgi:putative tryptophan/tyrosine transport system substrate-binding protein